MFDQALVWSFFFSPPPVAKGQKGFLQTFHALERRRHSGRWEGGAWRVRRPGVRERCQPESVQKAIGARRNLRLPVSDRDSAQQHGNPLSGAAN